LRQATGLNRAGAVPAMSSATMVAREMTMPVGMMRVMRVSVM
jgi:hypothetical protein